VRTKPVLADHASLEKELARRRSSIAPVPPGAMSRQKCCRSATYAVGKAGASSDQVTFGKMA